MRAEDLLTWVNASPFAPFQIRLNSGRTFDIRHSKMLKVGRSVANIFTYLGGADGPFEQMEMVSLVLIENIERLDTAKPADTTK